jgi:hypothetical protein
MLKQESQKQFAFITEMFKLDGFIHFYLYNLHCCYYNISFVRCYVFMVVTMKNVFWSVNTLWLL